MTDDETGPDGKGSPETSAKAPPKSAAEQRAERLKAALRDNLRRRKAQVRGRSLGSGPDETPESGGEA
ncbi:hypothetical protein [Methylobacterium sp. Leaf88]|uniref:hypothetical protein n=1 Tax=Methylobacterium sp. Leaf88 TaxID=1736244 RepID=UPI0006F5E12E|nr:hypothetical protein [Methylobacterium sp. Leaf88]KQO65535.1 hypothetical protein ASF20_06405 [Methylobacterium sp. Leaf88]